MGGPLDLLGFFCLLVSYSTLAGSSRNVLPLRRGWSVGVAEKRCETSCGQRCSALDAAEAMA